jgi:cytochrome c oxidase assembly protein subunit 20
MKRAVEIIDRKKVEKEAEAQRKREERRRQKEELDRVEEEMRRNKTKGGGWKFW